MLSLAILATVLGTMAWISNRGCGSCMPAVFSMGCCMIVKTGIGLYVRGQELIQEFGSMFMFATLLTVFLCSRCSQHKAVLSFCTTVQCWQVGFEHFGSHPFLHCSDPPSHPAWPHCHMYGTISKWWKGTARAPSNGHMLCH